LRPSASAEDVAKWLWRKIHQKLLIRVADSAIRSAAAALSLQQTPDDESAR
jgi:hypothetical protein